MHLRYRGLQTRAIDRLPHWPQAGTVHTDVLDSHNQKQAVGYHNGATPDGFSCGYGYSSRASWLAVSCPAHMVYYRYPPFKAVAGKE